MLASSELGFTRDGRRLLVIDREAATSALAVVDTRGEPTRRTEIPELVAAAGFTDQIWTVRELPHAEALLEQRALDGRVLATLTVPRPKSATLVAAPVGDAAVLWGGRAIASDGEALRVHDLPACDLALPLTGRRWVTVTGSRVVVPSGLVCELEAGARVMGGAIVVDGTAAALIVGRPSGGRELVVMGLSNARVLMRRALVEAAFARIAVRRGVLALAVEQAVVLIDLRSGQVTTEVPLAGPDALADLAIDPDGRCLVMRDRRGGVDLVDIEASRPGSTTVVEDVPEAPALPRLDLATAPPVSANERAVVTRPLPLRGLAPLDPQLPMDRTGALALLDVEMRTVALRTLRAIAVGWDSRRIGYGNEGVHPFEHEVAALLGMNGGFAGDHLAAAEAHLAAHEAQQPTYLRSRTTPVGALAAELDLSPLAVEVLLAVAAPALWSETARLYGILANDTGRAVVDEALLGQVLGPTVDRHALAAELDPRAPLVRLGAIVVEPRARPFAALAVHPVVLARLRCEVPELGGGVVSRGSDRTLEELALGERVIPDAIEALARCWDVARIVVRGRVGSGRRTLLASLAAEAHRALGVIDASVLPRRHGALPGALAAALRSAHLAGLVPCVVGIDDVAFEERDVREEVGEVLRAHPGPVTVILPTDATAPFAAGHISIDLPLLEERDRITVWMTALADAAVTVANVATLAARYRIGPGAIHRSIGALDRTALPADATPLLERYLRQLRDGRVGEHARRVERLASWDRLVLPADILDSLKELVARVRHRRTVFETWGMDQAMATSRGLTALFSGPPGTGKTLVAGVIARELGLDLYQVDLSKLMSRWLGETERNLAAIFDAAEDGQVVLLFDEADSLFAKRTEVRSSNDRYANLEVNYLLQRLDAFEGIAILTTNSAKAIDPAFRRRLSFRLSFPFPDEDTREQLWRAHLPPALPIAGELALDRLAHKYQLSGGYIRNACLRAAFLAAEDSTALGQHHLERAVALEFAELGKLSSSGSLD